MGAIHRSISNDPEGSSATGLLLDVATRPEPTKSRRLQATLRHAIRSGRLQPGDRVPSSRALAADLGWARNVVVDAYNQLGAEGYLTSRVGHGTRVADRPIVETKAVAVDAAPIATDSAPIAVDLQPGLPDLAGFPIADWRRSLNSTLDRLPAGALSYGERRGAPALRSSLAGYLNRARATDLQPEQIVVTTGVSASLRLVAATIGERGTPAIIAVEDPGAYTQWDALAAAGATIVSLPVDGEGAVVNRLAEVGADAVVVTPAHQYPLGGVLSPERRSALVAWARAGPDRLIVEDDYDAEFRYDRQPVGSIQGIAPDVTAITSSVSKTLAPGLRLGWLALPTGRAEPVATRLSREYVAPDAIQQHALADLIDSGRYDRIIRGRRRTYGRRRQRMIGALIDVPGCSVMGAASGLHLVVRLPDGVDDRAVSQQLLGGGVDVPPLSRYRRTMLGPPGLVASFASATDYGIERFSAELSAVLSG